MSETSRTHHYLYSQTGPPLLRTLEQYILTQNLSTVINMPNSGLDSMIDLDKVEDLSRLYRLFTIVPTGLPILRRSLKDSILRRGKDINQSSISSEVAEDVDVDVDEVDTTVTASKGKGKGKARAQGPPQTLTLALKWVQDVLDLKDRFDRLWKQAFGSHREVEGALDEVFTCGRIFLVLIQLRRLLKTLSILTTRLPSSFPCSLMKISRKALKV